MDGYLIDLDGMGGLIESLDTAAERITTANNRLKDASPSDLGSHAIDSAGRQFQDRWEHGTGKIAEAADKMVQSLQDTKRLYEEVEREICRLFPAAGAGDSADGAVGGAVADSGSTISSALSGDR